MKITNLLKTVYLAGMLALSVGNVGAQTLENIRLTDNTPVPISITMNGTSQTMTLTPKDGGIPVEVGTPTSYKYTFNAAPDDYVLSAYDTDTNLNGTVELTVTGDTAQSFSIVTVTAGATNAGWVLGTDYTVDYRAVGKEGAVRIVTAGTGTAANRITFPMLVGDSYSVNLIPNEDSTAAGYMKAGLFGTVTANVATAQGSIAKGSAFYVVVPEGASVFIGEKMGAVNQGTGGVHYLPFPEKEPVGTPVTKDGKTIYQYFLAKNSGTYYNYRVSQAGKITNAGKFNRNTYMDTLEITADMLSAARPDSIDHNPTNNSGANVGDILMNINAQGHLKLNRGNVRSILTLRSWQLTDDCCNNYFIEPDFHFTVVNESGQPDTNVITVDKKGLIKAKSAGTAIVLVTYDAISLLSHKYTETDKTILPYYYGSFWGAIWPENTGTFVVTVDGNDDTSIKPNMYIQEELRTGEIAADVDAEFDVFYYHEDSTGYTYTFKPEGVASVSIANPVLGANIANYTGFMPVTANADSSYTVLLTFGRNIIKLTSAGSVSKYQVISAKPVGYEIVNKSRPGEPVFPGDDITVQFHGFFHPANKLAGIYNQTAAILYNGVPNENSVILGPGQYQFGGSPEAQLVNVHINPNNEADFVLKNGAIQVNGFGSIQGRHRAISTEFGVAPNFNAVVRVSYFGSIPNVKIPITKPTEGVYFTGVPDSAKITVTNDVGDTIQANPQGQYLASYRNGYAYKITLNTYKTVWETFDIKKGQGIVEIPVQMEKLDTAIDWDGTTKKEPAIVSPEEGNTAGGVFEGMTGYYKLSTGAELAWFANAVNTGNYTYNAILTSDINLAFFSWTRIGSSSATSYKGTFDGGNHIIVGLYINTTVNYQGLFGYVNAATIRNLTVKGRVTSVGSSTGNYVAGIVAYSTGISVVQNCHNQVVVSGRQNVGGILGASASADITITDCSNSANITASNTYAGGIAGNVPKALLLARLANTGNIISTSNYSGGLFGNVAANITDAFNTGNVTGGASYVGGISGQSNAVNTISNVYNTGIVKSGKGAIITNNTATTVNNAYTLNNVGMVDTNVTVKTAETFVSGEVAWLLDSAFGQTIGADALPILNGATVYRIVYTNNLDVETVTFYTNGVLPEIEKDGYTGIWYTEAGGTVVNGVIEDCSLYLLFTDIAAPTVPTDLAGVPTETNIALTWTASTDNVGVVKYNVYVDGQLVDTVTETNYTITGLTAETQYTIEVEAVDAAGNISPKASVVLTTGKSVGNSLSAVDSKISIYPNPFTDYINIYAVADGNATVYNILGKKILSVTVKAGSNRINTSMLPKGFYVVNFGTNTVKVVK
ncbi:MAG: T9SS type A sorting domain-containing protein [Bacteroidales bacterium]|jgi:hypothetical protein|nr:T9SS type A sorting domain-containing protein [Bacteroidales bacterium]